MGTTALNPFVMPLLVPGAVALGILLTAAISLIVLGRKVKKWFEELFTEFVRSPGAEELIGKIAGRVATEFMVPLEHRLAAMETRLLTLEEISKMRAETIARLWAQRESDKNAVDGKIDKMGEKVDSLATRILDKLFNREP